MKSPERLGKVTGLPDALPEEEVNLTLNWTAGERTTRRSNAKGNLLGFATPTHYLPLAFSQQIAGNEGQR